VLSYILRTLQPNTDLALVGYPVTDEFSHQFMGLITPTDIDGNPNPYYDDLEGNGTPDGRIAIREATSGAPTTRPTRSWRWPGH
jgi:hypothetical protein